MTDERSLAIVLTAQGQALRAQAEAIPGTMMRRLGMDEAELVQLHATMMKVIDAAADADDDSRA